MTEIDWRARAEAAEAERDALNAEMGGVIARGIEQQERAVAAEARIARVERQLEAGPPSAFSGVKRQGYNWCANAVRAALEEPVATVPAPGGSDVNEILAASRAAVVEPVGEPPRPTAEETAAMDALVEESERLGLYRENYLSWDALRADVERINARVGDPQPSACATWCDDCGNTRHVCDSDSMRTADSRRGCAWEGCAMNRRPCPSCTPSTEGTNA